MRPFPRLPAPPCPDPGQMKHTRSSKRPREEERNSSSVLSLSEEEEEVMSLHRHTCPFSFPSFVFLGSCFMADALSYQRSCAPSNFLSPAHHPPLSLKTIPQRLLKTRREACGGWVSQQVLCRMLRELRAWYSLDVTGRPSAFFGPQSHSVRACPQSPHLCPPQTQEKGSAGQGHREGWPLPSGGRIYLYERRLCPNKAKVCMIIFQKAVLFLRLHLLCISPLE